MAKIIDFNSSSPLIAAPPSTAFLSGNFYEALVKEATHFGKNVLVATSGTTGTYPKIVVLSKEGFLFACRTVNEFLGCSKKDSWLLALPEYHIGGLSIHGRAFLSGSSLHILKERWDPQLFLQTITQNSITRSSLVPTQIYDIVRQNLTAPSCLQSILVGGGKLDSDLRQQAVQLGWPVISTFGMTETSAMFAVEDEEGFYPLSHMTIQCSEDSRLMIKGESMLQGYLSFKDGRFSFTDPKQDGWFLSEDIVHYKQNRFTPLGRIQRIIKVKGELVSLDAVADCIADVWPSLKELFVTSLPNPRSENDIILVTTDRNLDLRLVQDSLNGKLAKYAYPVKIAYIDAFPKTGLGKIKEDEIKKQIIQSYGI